MLKSIFADFDARVSSKMGITLATVNLSLDILLAEMGAPLDILQTRYAQW